MSKFCANYSKTLVGADSKKYEDKKILCENLDPYEMEISYFGNDVYPKVMRDDLVQYLILKTDTYTLKQMKAYKSLEAHNYVTSGLVKFVLSNVLSEEKVLIISKVGHSQSMNSTLLRVWVLCKPDGEVITSHCNCMAGLSSVCSHVGAVLFWLELATLKNNTTSCTSMDNAWLPPNTAAVSITEVKDCNFSSAEAKWKRLQEESVATRKKRKSSLNLEEAEADFEELRSFLSVVDSSDPDAAVLNVFPGFSSERKLADSCDNLDHLILSNLFDKTTADLSFSELSSVPPFLIL